MASPSDQPPRIIPGPGIVTPNGRAAVPGAQSVSVIIVPDSPMGPAVSIVLPEPATEFTMPAVKAEQMAIALIRSAHDARRIAEYARANAQAAQDQRNKDRQG